MQFTEERNRRLAEDKEAFQRYEAMMNGLLNEGEVIAVYAEGGQTSGLYLARGRLLEWDYTPKKSICKGERPWARGQQFIDKRGIGLTSLNIIAKENNGAYEFEQKGIRYEINPAEGTCLYLNRRQQVKTCKFRSFGKADKDARDFARELAKIRTHCNKFYSLE